MRAKRVSEGEATQSDVVELVTVRVRAVNLETGDEVEMFTRPAVVAREFPSEAKRFCKRCEAAAGGVGLIVSRASRPVSLVSDKPVIVASTGTAHLDAGEGLTLCGIETSGW